MAEAFVANYYNLFDKRIENSTLIVVIICLCIVLVGLLTPSAGAYGKTNIFETQNVKNTIQIDGQTYEIVLKKL